MAQLSLHDIRDLFVTARRKILLAALIFAAIIAPAVYLLAPAKYSIETQIVIPHDSAKMEEYEIQIRRSLLAGVCRRLSMDDSEESVARLDGRLSIAVNGQERKIYLGFRGDDAAAVAAIGNGISMETLRYARAERIAYLEELAEVREERIEAIDGLLEDEYIAEYYKKLSREWRALLEEAGPGLNVFLELDPTIRDLHMERRNLRSEVARIKKEITGLREEGDSVLKEQYSPIYRPDEKEPPRLLLVLLLSAAGGLILGLLWVAVFNSGINKYKKEGI